MQFGFFSFFPSLNKDAAFVSCSALPHDYNAEGRRVWNSRICIETRQKFRKKHDFGYDSYHRKRVCVCFHSCLWSCLTLTLSQNTCPSTARKWRLRNAYTFTSHWDLPSHTERGFAYLKQIWLPCRSKAKLFSRATRSCHCWCIPISSHTGWIINNLLHCCWHHCHSNRTAVNNMQIMVQIKLYCFQCVFEDIKPTAGGYSTVVGEYWLSGV